MKRSLCLILCAAMLLSLLAACQPPAAEPDPSAGQSEPPTATAPAEAELSCSSILSSVWMRLDILLSSAEVYGFSHDDAEADDQEQMAAYIQGAYGLGEGEWEDAAIARETGASAVEMAVLRFADEDAAQHGYDCLKDYLHGREGDFTGYAPAQAKLAADAALVIGGQYVGLFIVADSDYAGRVFSEIVETGEIPEPTPAPGPIDDVNELLEELLAFCELQGDNVSDLERVDGSDPARLKSILEEEYQLADYPVEEAVIVRGTSGSVFELAVLRAADGQDPWKLCSVLTQDYLDVKEDACARFPAQAELLSRAIAGNPSGSDFVVMVVCSDPDLIIRCAIGLLGTNGYSSSQRHFNASKPIADPDPDYPGRTRFVDPGKEDMSVYDTGPIRAAWGENDPAGLSEKDRAVYDAAREILGEIIRGGMTDLEKETAIYRWLVNNVNYDYTHQDILAETPRVSYEPYGGLVARSAVCLGYATSFQLLCDLAGVECITVVGACFNSEEHHGWNMVRLDGEWYCVDATWDANGREQLGDGYEWRYFNVTSDEMAKNHQWDYSNTPEAAVGS